eukprot:1161837-Pelagomonas_calceolata.AAC.4
MCPGMAQPPEDVEHLYSGSLSEYESSEEEEEEEEEESALGAEEALTKAEALVAASAAAAAAGLCAVCMEQPHKYCCPGCGCRTCSLPCSKQHKANTGCTGQRDRLGYVPLQGFDDKQLLSGGRGGCDMLFLLVVIHGAGLLAHWHAALSGEGKHAVPND